MVHLPAGVSGLPALGLGARGTRCSCRMRSVSKRTTLCAGNPGVMSSHEYYHYSGVRAHFDTTCENCIRIIIVRWTGRQARGLGPACALTATSVPYSQLGPSGSRSACVRRHPSSMRHIPLHVGRPRPGAHPTARLAQDMQASVAAHLYTRIPPLRYWLFTPELQWQPRDNPAVNVSYRERCRYTRISPLQYRLLTPEWQWQSRGKCAWQGGVPHRQT